MEVKEKLQEVFRFVFDDESIKLFDEMTSEDIDEWDSLMHISLINEIERQFGILFTTEEITETKNVGEFIRIIESKFN